MIPNKQAVMIKSYKKKDAKNVDVVLDNGPCKHMQEYCSNKRSTSKKTSL